MNFGELPDSVRERRRQRCNMDLLSVLLKKDAENCKPEIQERLLWLRLQKILKKKITRGNNYEKEKNNG